MITNERQLQTARVDADRFRAALAEDGAVAGVDPVVIDAQRVAMTAQLTELESDIADYLDLKSGRVRTFGVANLTDLPAVLIKARIAAGMTQRDLAERLQLKEQQIQRYEAHLYEGASFSRVADVAAAVGLALPDTLRLAETRSLEALFARTVAAGVDPSFVTRRVAASTDPAAIARGLELVYGWSQDALFGAGPLELPRLGGTVARFKMPRGRSERAAAAYAAYAFRLATICASTRAAQRGPDIPVEAAPMRDLVQRRGGLTFANALETAWDLGVIVLPLSDPGAFHGACWRIGWINVIVLKQGERVSARWLIDLLHELFHAGRHPELPEFEVVEAPETAAERRDDPEERQATWFASLVATDGKAEDLFKRAVDVAGADLARLKRAIVRVAEEATIDAGILANYAAFRLSLQGEDFWATAANLQDRSEDPLAIARETFFRRFDFASLDRPENDLLALALSDEA